MIFTHKLVYLLLISLVCVSSITQGTMVRVLLEDSGDDIVWKFVAPRGFKVVDGTSQEPLNLKATHHTITVSCSKEKMSVNGYLFEGKALLISSIKRHAQFNGGYYDGYFLIIKENNRYFLINVVDLEEYVFAVLRTESWPGWPLEINKVMAITCRTYLLYQMFESKKKGMVYHIKNTNVHQTYSGAHMCPVIRKAVEETKGMFIAHAGKPILAMFDCCCGGIVPAKVQGVVSFSKAPYLRRSYACNHCKTYKVYSWKKDYSAVLFKELLENALGKDCGDILDAKVTLRDSAGLVKQVTVKTSKGTRVVSGSDMYKYVKGIKSFCFSITCKNSRSKKRRRFVIEGKGFGHHMGLCQWGARDMVKHGHGYLSILSFYYPGTTVKVGKTDE